MTRMRLSLLILSTLLIVSPHIACAEEYKPDDRVVLDVAAEDWVTTKTARVIMNVETAVTGNASSSRENMTKALESLIKTDWRLISFDRTQDRTGLERWSAMFEARIPENQLAGIHDSVKKVSKPGMQITVGGIDFSPTLDEIQAAQSQLRVKIYKQVNDQLAALNAALPGRSYRIALVDFTGRGDMMPMRAPRAMRMNKEMMAEDAASGAEPAMEQSMERSQKLMLTANVVFAVTPPTTPAATK